MLQVLNECQHFLHISQLICGFFVWILAVIVLLPEVLGFFYHVRRQNYVSDVICISEISIKRISIVCFAGHGSSSM